MMTAMHNHSAKPVLPTVRSLQRVFDRTIKTGVLHHAALMIKTPFYPFVFSSIHPFAAAASVPASETESVNTENQNGEDEKTTCCGPLW